MKMINKRAVLILIILALSYLEYRMLVMIHSSYLLENAIATMNPLSGHAWWKAWQSRLLAGWLMEGIQKPQEEAYGVFVFISCVLMNVINYVLYSRK
ncbi:MAG: hypothetical protein ABR936_17125 [Bacteroidota bacterium]